MTASAPDDLPDFLRVRRAADRGVYDADAIDAILDEGIVAHVGIETANGPMVIPMAYGRDGDSILLHGSVASRLMRTNSTICATVTLLDGIVVARSLFESSMNYRSVVVVGQPIVITEPDEKLRALLVLSDRLIPGRVGHARGPSDSEVRQTTVWRLLLTDASAKVRTGGPVELPEDLDLPYWAGVIPLELTATDAIADADHPPIEPMPQHVMNWNPRRTQ